MDQQRRYPFVDGLTFEGEHKEMMTLAGLESFDQQFVRGRPERECGLTP